jgi:hypothetical protein
VAGALPNHRLLPRCRHSAPLKVPLALGGPQDEIVPEPNGTGPGRELIVAGATKTICVV